ncbi:MAG: hypothetical protein AAGK04_13480 [Planctomycetota bacterium]
MACARSVRGGLVRLVTLVGLAAPGLAVAQAQNESVFSADAAAEAPKPSKNRFKSVYEMDAWAEYYYQQPDPIHFPAFLRTQVEQGRIGSGVGFAMCCAFGREIVKKNPEYIDVWHTELKNGTEVERYLLWNSIWWSGVDEAKPYFERLRAELPEDQQDTVNHFLTTEPGELREEAIDRDVVTRFMGEAYTASGDMVFVDRLIEEIDAPPVDVMHPTVRSGFVMPEEQIYRTVMDQLVLLGHRHDVVHKRLQASLDGLTLQGRPYMESVLEKINVKLASEASPDPSIGGRGLHADLIAEGAELPPPVQYDRTPTDAPAEEPK